MGKARGCANARMWVGNVYVWENVHARASEGGGGGGGEFGYCQHQRRMAAAAGRGPWASMTAACCPHCLRSHTTRRRSRLRAQCNAIPSLPQVRSPHSTIQSILHRKHTDTRTAAREQAQVEGSPGIAAHWRRCERRARAGSPPRAAAADSSAKRRSSASTSTASPEHKGRDRLGAKMCNRVFYSRSEMQDITRFAKQGSRGPSRRFFTHQLARVIMGSGQVCRLRAHSIA